MDLRDQLQRTLGDAYTLERELGGGGMSRVFVAEEKSLRRKVVVKVLPPELTAGVNVERFNREILLAAKLQHPHIVPVLSAGEMNGLPYYTMPLVEGESLRVRLARTNALSITEAVSVLREVARALAYAHERGIVHRDIKPDNVLMTGGSATVTDFGIAKAISASRTAGAGATLTQVGTSIGTPTYMSPEQAAGDPDTDHRTDIYSFGCMAYELLAGRPPFTEKSPRKLLAAHMGEKPQPVSELRLDTPSALAELVMRCLEKEADARPQHANDLVRVLETVTSSGTSPAMPAVLLGGKGMFRKALAIYAGAFVAVAILAKAAIVGIGLPDWVFPGSLIVMALGLPVVLWTGYVQRVARQAVTTTPTFTPGGTPSTTRGTIATMALKAAPRMSWYRTARGGIYALGTFIVLIAVFMVMRAFGIGPFGSLIGSGKLGLREKIILADFKSPPTDSLLGPTVTEAFRTDIGQSANLAVMPVNLVRDALRRMQKAPATRLDYAVAREVATREGAKAVIDGEVVALGGSYVLSARLLSAQSGEEIAAFRETASDAKDIIPAISRLSRNMRAKVGESLRKVQNTPSMEKVSTPSLEALQKYVAGTRANDIDGDFQKATQLLEEAIAIDTGFAMAYRRLAVLLSNRGVDRTRRILLAQKAYEHRDRLSDAERYNTIAYYYLAGPKPDESKAIAAYESLIELDSSNVSALNNVANSYSALRDYAKAERMYRRVIDVDPTISVAYGNLAGALIRQGKVAEAEQVGQLMTKNLPRNPATAILQRGLKARRGDYDGALAIADSVRKARANDAAQQVAQASFQSSVAMIRGQLAQALRFRREVEQRNRAAGNRQASLNEALNVPEYDARFRGDTAGARKGMEKALAANPLDSIPVAQRPFPRLIPLAAMVGRADLARSLMKQEEGQREALAVDPKAWEAGIHYQQGYIALTEHRYDDAVREWRAGDYGACQVCALPDIALAYDKGGHADSAIALLSRYVSSAERPLGADQTSLAMSHERLGQLYEQKGDNAKAAEHYRAFIDLWKNADPELQPRVAAAKARLMKLTPVEKPKP